MLEITFSFWYSLCRLFFLQAFGHFNTFDLSHSRVLLSGCPTLTVTGFWLLAAVVKSFLFDLIVFLDPSLNPLVFIRFNVRGSIQF